MGEPSLRDARPFDVTEIGRRPWRRVAWRRRPAPRAGAGRGSAR